MSRRPATVPPRAPDGDLALPLGLRLIEVAVGERAIKLRFDVEVVISLEGDLTVASRRMKLREAAYSVLEILGRTLTKASIARGELVLTFDKTHVLVAHADAQRETYAVTAPDRDRVAG